MLRIFVCLSCLFWCTFCNPISKETYANSDTAQFMEETLRGFASKLSADGGSLEPISDLAQTPRQWGTAGNQKRAVLSKVQMTMEKIHSDLVKAKEEMEYLATITENIKSIASLVNSNGNDLGVFSLSVNSNSDLQKPSSFSPRQHWSNKWGPGPAPTVNSNSDLQKPSSFSPRQHWSNKWGPGGK